MVLPAILLNTMPSGPRQCATLTFIQVQTHIPPTRTDTRSVRRSHWLRLAANLDWWALLSGAAVFPLANVNSFDRMSPWLILHGARDTIIPVFNARQLAKLRDMKHGVCKLSIYDEEGHGQRPPHLY
jgi:pimeloyl-ACP methyl ester carboxylesterase